MLSKAKSINSINNLQKLLADLKLQASAIDKQNSNNKAHLLLENTALFSTSLFHSQSDKFIPYLLETEKNIQHLSYLIEKQNHQLAISLLEKIELQLSAIKTAFNSNTVIHKEASIRQEKLNNARYKKLVKKTFSSSHQAYQKLAEYHQFERRLMAMLDEHNRNNDVEQGLIVHQRLGRCRQAISKVEREIEMLEKKQLN